MADAYFVPVQEEEPPVKSGGFETVYSLVYFVLECFKHYEDQRKSGSHQEDGA